MKRLAAAMVFALCAPAAAAAGEASGDCYGIDFNVDHPIAIAKVIADRPQINFVKNTADAASCPASTDACRRSAYLVPGDLVLVGKTHGDFTCIAYQPPADPKPDWTNGWLPSAAMTPVLPSPAPSRADWLGNCVHGGGHIAITPAGRGQVRVRGEAFYNAAQNVHTGVINATARPAHGLLQFADDGSEA